MDYKLTNILEIVKKCADLKSVSFTFFRNIDEIQEFVNMLQNKTSKKLDRLEIGLIGESNRGILKIDLTILELIVLDLSLCGYINLDFKMDEINQLEIIVNESNIDMYKKVCFFFNFILNFKKHFCLYGNIQFSNK